MIRLLLFAHLQEEIGQSELMVKADNITVEQLKNWIKTEYNISNMSSVMIAVK